MKIITKITLIGFGFSLFISCTTNKTINTTASNNSTTAVETGEKLSIAEKLKENKHLPIHERIALYHQLKTEQPNRYNFKEETELDGYAFELLKDDLYKESVAIFELNVEQFPNSSKAYDGLARSYNSLAHEYKELWKSTHEKSIEVGKVLDMKDDWGTEIFHFPIRFAPEINYKGIEDARFAKGWSDTTSNYFWTYIFGWNINLTEELTSNILEENMKLYFDGLLSGVNREKSVDAKITIAKFKKTTDNTFTGTVRIHDSFTTKRPLTLNVLVDYHYCESKKTTQILFHFSPKGFEHEVWEVLKLAKFRDDVCGI